MIFVVIAVLLVGVYKVSKLQEALMAVNAQVQAFKDKFDAALVTISANFDNITVDISNQAAAIQALKDQIANNPGDTLSPETQALLDEVAANAQTIADRSKVLADAVPDTIA